MIGWESICIEPNPYNYSKARLYRKFVLPYAIANKKGRQKLYLSDWSPDWSTLKEGECYKENWIEVECITLDDLIREYQIRKIDILSIDTEGMELEVLKSFDIAKIKPLVIIVEYNNAGVDISNKIDNYFSNISLYEKVHITPSNFIYKLK